MKNTILTIACCLMAVSAFAQKITEQQLTGKWEISFVNIEGTTIDFETGTITPAPGTAEAEGITEADLKSRIGTAMGTKADSYVLFEQGGQMLLSIRGQEEVRGQYTITEKNGQQFITHAGTEYRADITDGKLNLAMTVDEGAKIEMRFKKV